MTASPRRQLNESELSQVVQAKQQVAAAKSVGIDLVAESPSGISETYVELMGIPSCGILYAGAVEGQPLKVSDILLIQGMNETNTSQRFGEIIKRRVRGVDPAQILLDDELYIAFWLRHNSFPDSGFDSMPYQCEACEHIGQYSESKIPFSAFDWVIENAEAKLTKLKETRGAVQGTLPISKMPYTVRVRVRGHLARVNSIIRRDYTTFNKTVPGEIEELLHIFASIDLGFGDLMETVQYASNQMDPRDFVHLMKVTNDLRLAPNPTAHHVCTECGEAVTSTGYTFRPEIYLPVD
jgi:hypothetical protein